MKINTLTIFSLALVATNLLTLKCFAQEIPKTEPMISCNQVEGNKNWLKTTINIYFYKDAKQQDRGTIEVLQSSDIQPLKTTIYKIESSQEGYGDTSPTTFECQKIQATPSSYVTTYIKISEDKGLAQVSRTSSSERNLPEVYSIKRVSP